VSAAAPTVLWRLFKRPGHRGPGNGGQHVRAVILPGGPPHTLAFFANDEMDRVENYDTMDLVLFRAQEIRQSLLDDGFVED
jgi:hypothetical protein